MVSKKRNIMYFWKPVINTYPSTPWPRCRNQFGNVRVTQEEGAFECAADKPYGKET